jgi:hypothetical protein
MLRRADKMTLCAVQGDAFRRSGDVFDRKVTEKAQIPVHRVRCVNTSRLIRHSAPEGEGCEIEAGEIVGG